jgi:oxygen-independent coproporphyrinogen-3 oxidase
MINLGIYVQIPFCASKCSFCNFSSRVAHPGVFDAYVAALATEIGALASSLKGQGIPSEICKLTADSIYLGGGTPSLLGAARLQRLVHALLEEFQFSVSPEFTIEVTPGSADQFLLGGLHDIGLNRLSIGAQSFNDRELSSVGRLHSSAQTRELVRAARPAGFSNINLDLIAGLPYQTSSSWLASVRAAIDLAPEHISVYLFEVDGKSRLGGEVINEGARYHAPAVPGDDFMADAYEAARAMLAAAGYVQYEISNFALPGFESAHNRKYWQLKPYVGLGAGAHSFDGTRRWANEVAVEKYQELVARRESPIVEMRELSTQEQIEEFFFLGLRQKAGVSLIEAREYWGQTEVSRWESKLAALAGAGRIERRAEQVFLPDNAYLVSNEIFQEFLE